MKPARALFKSGIAVVLMSMLTVSQAMASGEACKAIFQTDANTPNDIDRSIKDLVSFRLKLDEAKASGQSSTAISAQESDYLKREREIFDFLITKKIMSREELKERIRQEIAHIQSKDIADRRRVEEEKKKETEKQHRILESSVIDGTRAVFFPIKPGSFKMGEPGKGVDVTLTKPFEMMATPTTQVIWQTVAELANRSLGYEIRETPSKFKGETLPVETISYDEIVLWIKALNELSRLGVADLSKVIVNHKDGDVYRLPTEAEWEWVVRGAQNSNNKYFFGNNSDQVADYAWIAKNSDQTTHPVAQKNAQIIDGNPIYDMLGNVSEVVADGWFRGEIQPGPIYDPFVPVGTGRYDEIVIRGSCWFDKETESESHIRHPNMRDAKNFARGFRFVREVK